ncbi:uncharacterized protein LOC114519473 [Dendronephthya gigantea]|uniref:uncharacterized protein LOC114519473 n=1 Tax=Dendronephthya gigantea TaxID=151771 RepID=UPI00106B7A00|nr:uncharacterized protein LOC114519473 [Dendronephthya gigantea]
MKTQDEYGRSYGDIASKLLNEILGGEQVFPASCGYHRKCYQLFTNKKNLKSSKKRSSQFVDESNESIPRKKTRLSQDTTSQIVKGTVPLFGKKCIICQKEKYKKDSRTGAYKPEPLTKCMSPSAENAVKVAAQKKQDENVLLIVEGEDLIAKEAQYHHSCFRTFTYIPVESKISTGDAYLKFCSEIIQERIIGGGEIIKISKLAEIYSRYLQPDTDASYLSNWNLKRKLKKSFPSLVYIKVKEIANCELVCSCEQNTMFVAPESTEESSDEDEVRAMGNLEPNDQRQLFLSSQIVKKAIEMSPRLNVPNPPLASDLTEDAAQKIVPIELFNFLAWITGVCCEPVSASEKKLVELDNDTERQKILSICQDIIYLKSKGRRIVPKHLILGLTIRHLTGSSKLIDIVSGLGHCISPKAVIDYDSDLARYRAQQSSVIPRGFSGSFTTCVFDNNDINEETLSGKGTTHCTTGIVIQRMSEASVLDDENRHGISKSRGKRVEVSSTEIEPFVLKKKLSLSTRFEVTDIDESRPVGFDNICYVLAKFRCDEEEETPLPSWSGFFTQLTTQVPEKSRIGYLPIIDGSPTDLGVVNAVLSQSIDIADKLNQNSMVVVMDEAVYAKAQWIRWTKGMFQSRIVLRLGEFHVIMSFLGVIGKRFQDGGLRDILIESNIIAKGSVNGVLSGKHYNRSIRSMKIIYEAIYRLVITAFLDSMSVDERNCLEHVVHDMKAAFSNGTFTEFVKSDDVQNFVRKLHEFTSERGGSNPTFGYWLSFLEMVDILLEFVRATRVGDWSLHLSSVRRMLPWIFAYDRVHYSRYLPIYWLEMLNLPTSNPDIHEQMVAGNFATQRTSQPFSQTPMDQTLEQTLNKNSKTKGGVIGFSINKSAVHRWIKSFSDRAEIQSVCESMAGRGNCTRQRKEMDITRRLKDEKAVKSVINTIEAMTNPVSIEDDELVNIVSGAIASPEVKHDIARAKTAGEEQCAEYIDLRLKKKELDVFNTIKALKLKTFSLTSKTVKAKSEKAVLQTTARDLARVLIVAKFNNLDFKYVLSYPLCPVPLSLANYDGTLAKTDKSAIGRHLESNVEDVSNSNRSTAWIIDAMALIQRLKNIPNTFDALSAEVLKSVIATATRHRCTRVDFVTDQYPDSSIKGAERERRKGKDASVIRLNVDHGSKKTPKQFKKFLSVGKNKESLINFFL